jgi:endonuclease/exonuclease/phosphatase family metal-dependent hydrolase
MEYRYRDQGYAADEALAELLKVATPHEPPAREDPGSALDRILHADSPLAAVMEVIRQNRTTKSASDHEVEIRVREKLATIKNRGESIVATFLNEE